VPSFVTAYSYEPLADEPGSDLGNLYVVMEVLVSGRASEEVADLVIETIGDQYYNQAQNNTDALTQFENAIKSVNRELREYVNKGNAAWIGKLSAAVAIQVGTEVHVAQTGSAEAFLYRGKATTQISTKEPNRPSTPNKTFGSIATGQLEPGDRILLATPALIHQIPLNKLKEIITGAGPNAAIAEITDLLRNASADRIAALVIEATTPELAALQVRSEQPSEIKLGAPDNALEAAKIVAAPIAHSTVHQSKKVASVAQAGWHRAKPQAREFGLAATSHLRQTLSTKLGRRLITLLVIAILVIIVAISLLVGSNNKKTALFTKYQNTYQQFVRGQQSMASGDNSAAASIFEQVNSNLSQYKSQRMTLDHELTSSKIPADEPKTYAAFIELVQNNIDQANGLTRIAPTTLATLSSNSKAQFFELSNGVAYVFDTANQNALHIINVSSGSISESSADTSQLGKIVSTVLSSANDGIYILTSTPSVWFYNFRSDSISQEKIAGNKWPVSSQIASYASNLYFLDGNSIYKAERVSNGFSLPDNYVNATTNAANKPTALAVNGAILLLSPSGLNEYSQDKIVDSSTTNSEISQANILHSTNSPAILLASDATSNRIAIWTTANGTISYSKLLAIENISNLYDATYDNANMSLYITADNKLLRATITP
jgi:hypothetical protein